MTTPDLAGLAERVLTLVSGRAEEAAVAVTSHRQGLTRFANSAIHQNVGDERTTVSLTVALGGRVATGSTSIGGPSDPLGDLVGQALAAASVQPVDAGWPGVGAPTGPADPRGGHDPATAMAGPDERAGVVAAFVSGAGGLEAAGYCETTDTTMLFATTAGGLSASAATTATVDGIARLGGVDGVSSTTSACLGDLDGAACGAGAAASARRSAASPALELPPGRYEVVLSPRCVAYMLDFLTFYGFNARAVAEGRSFARLGEVQLDPRLSMWDDATDARHVGLRIDAEGTAKGRLSLVERGRTTGLTHDRRTALAAGATSTGHAVPGGASIGAVATNTFLDAADPVDAAALVAGVGDGLYVGDFWYTRVLDPRSLVVTGLTRNGVWVVRDGQLGAPVRNMRFTQSPVAALAPDQVLGAADDARLAPGGLHLSSHRAPSLHLASWHFTGGAAG